MIGTYMDASSPAIDQNGSFYHMGDVKGMLHKFQDNGTSPPTRPWKVQIGTKITASPVIGSDGTVYIGSTNGLSAVQTTPDGKAAKILWNFQPGSWTRPPRWGATTRSTSP